MERDREAAEVHELLTRPSAGERWGTSLNYVRRGSGDPLLLLHSLDACQRCRKENVSKQ